jgi:hypothetical protein
MSYYYAFYADTEVRQVSKRCFGRLAGVFSGGCSGVNPGSLHVVISNMLGLRKQGFIADVDRWKEVWNQPVLGFKSVILGNEKIKTEQKDRGVAKVIRVKTDFIYAGELNRNAPADELEDFNMWTPVFGTVFQQRKTAKYEYTLEIDNGGHIVGGDWISEERPDFIWTQEKAEFTDFFAPLNELYKPIKLKR